ncbi:Deformed epidermal autoregulatory factor 1-like, partial [Homarus americanus]
MNGGLGESPSGGSRELVAVSDLEAVGLTRPHSVPLVKIVTSTTHLSDVINNPLNDVITATPDVTIHANDVTLSPEANIITCTRENCTTTSTHHITPATSSSLGETKATATFHIEPDWREAAQEPVLIVRCKKTAAELVKSKFGSGSRGRCIRLGKQWYTPTEFEAHCGRSASKDWKRSISVSGARVLLEELRERTHQETLDVRQKLLQEKEEAVTQAKLEAQLSNIA